MVFAFALLAAACGGSSGSDASDSSPNPAASAGSGAVDKSSMDALIASLGTPAAPNAVAPTDNSTTTRSLDADTIVACTNHHFTGNAVFENFVRFDPNGDALWPGSLVQYKGLSDGQLTPIALARQAGTVTVANALIADGSGAAVSNSSAVQSPSLATVQDAIHGILGAGATVNLAAKSDFSTDAVRSFDELALKLGVSANWLRAGGGVKFDGDWKSKKSTFVVRLNQQYFTASFAAPASPGAFFDPSVTPDQALTYMGPDNPPAYVASVTYGRMLFMKVESDESESTLGAAINATFNAVLAKTSVELDANTKSTMAHSNVSVMAIGGSPDDVAALESAGDGLPDALAAYLSRGANYSSTSPGAPIGYSVRFLRNNESVRVASPLDYSVAECGPAVSAITVTLDDLDVTKNGAALGAGAIHVHVEIPDTSATFDRDFTAVSDGANLSLAWPLPFQMVQTDQSSFVVSTTISSIDHPSEVVTTEHKHLFSIDRSDPANPLGAWSESGSSVSLAGKATAVASTLDVSLNYTAAVH